MTANFLVHRQHLFTLSHVIEEARELSRTSSITALTRCILCFYNIILKVRNTVETKLQSQLSFLGYISCMQKELYSVVRVNWMESKNTSFLGYVLDIVTF